MRFAFADPPYLGLAAKFYGDMHPEAAVYDTIEGHRALIERLQSEFDGWAMCLHEGSLRHILPLCPEDVRVMSWVKPWCSFKPSVRVAYAWEPIIVRGGRPFEGRETDTVRDWISANMEQGRGLVGAKPPKVIRWLLQVLNARPEDEVVDLFPGSGVVSAVLENFRTSRGERQLSLVPPDDPVARKPKKAKRKKLRFVEEATT